MKITKCQVTYHEEEVPSELMEFRKWEFTSGSTVGQDFVAFAKLYKQEVKRQLPKDTWLVKFRMGHYFLSGFIHRSGQHVYFSIPDVRHFPGEWYDHILIRTAKSDEDYTGGPNNYTPLQDFGRQVLHLLGVA